MRLTLDPEIGDFQGTVSTLELSPAGLIIGRSLEVDWSLPDPTRRLSSRHCEIEFRDGGYWLRDLSKNGTYLNGDHERLQAPRQLRNGDEFVIGPYRVSVEEPEETIFSLGGGDQTVFAPARPSPPPPPARAAEAVAKSARRKLTAILAADIFGFSRLTRADEDETLGRIRALRADLINPSISSHDGRAFKHVGDGFLAEFESVVDAVRCALAVQRSMGEFNASIDPDRHIIFRMGIHIGDIVEEVDGDLMGDGVNIAARLEGIAEPGGIVLSEDAFRFVRGRFDFAARDLGPVRLKNIADPIRAFAVDDQAQSEETVAVLRRNSRDRMRLGLVAWSALAAVVVAAGMIVVGLVFWR
jgi:class 3 adenylate cyclase